MRRSVLRPLALVLACSAASLLACGDDRASTSSNHADLRVELPGTTEPVRSGSYDFGEVQIGQSSRVGLKVTNVGTDLAAITSTRFEEAPSGTFFASAPASVAPGDTRDLYITFAPTKPGPFSGRMVIEHDGDSISVSLNLSGVGK